MYSKIFQLNSETFYNYKDRWKIDVKNDLYGANTYTKSEIEDILNNFVVNTFVYGKNRPIQSRITLYMFSDTDDIVDSWGKGRQPPEIFLRCSYGKNQAMTRQLAIAICNPEAFRFKLIRTLARGNKKIYTDIGPIDLPIVEIHSNVMDYEKLSYIEEWYEVVIASFNRKKEEIKKLKRRYF